jgi:glycosyltransferase involved in cell wall biosynthesis
MISIAGLSRRADLIHAHDARSHTWAATLAGGLLVVSRRVAFPVGQSFLSKWKYRRAQRYLAVSHHVKQTLIEAEVPEERISVVYDGVDVPQRIASGDRIVALSTRDPMKGSDLVEEAAAISGVRVHFSTDLERDLESAALFLYITRSEGLGSAALMSMAAGVPVVASRVGGLPEIVKDGETGVLTDNEPRAIADGIHRALAIREALSANARRLVEERFSRSRMIEETRRIYDQVLA